MSKAHAINVKTPLGTLVSPGGTPLPSADTTGGNRLFAGQSDVTDLPPGTMLGGYRIERMLGMGGMGAVYLATDTHLGRQVAVKTMRPDVAVEPQVRERFLREARAAAAIDNEHVVPVYAVGDAAGSPYLVMPLLRGEALDSRLQHGSWPSLAETCRLAREIAAGLAAAHAAGVIHRDVKPSNVWLDGATGRARLLDFGLARPAQGGEALTRAGVVLGTPAYMAPEQAAGGTVDHRADLFSLGVLLYELTTCRRPFVGDSVLALLTALAIHDPLPACELNPKVPAGLSHLIARLLSKSLSDRPASAAEVVTELAAVEPSLSATRSESSASGPTALLGWFGRPIRGWSRLLPACVLGSGGASVLASACSLAGCGEVWSEVALAASGTSLSLFLSDGSNRGAEVVGRRTLKCGLGLAIFGGTLAAVRLCSGSW